MRALPAAVLVALAGSAAAQSTHVRLEASLDPSAGWSSTVAAMPGDTVHVRVRMALEDGTALGMAGVTYQPTLSNWGAGDERLAFTFPGLDGSGWPTSETAYNGTHVPASPPTNTGRIFPFGASGQTLTSGSGLLTSFVDPGNTLRFAGSKAAAAEPWWGIASSQLQPSLGGTNFVTSLDVVIFRYAVRLGPASSPREMVATVPVNHMSLGRCVWYTTPNGLNSLRANVSAIDDATITVAPSPGPLAVGVLSLAIVRPGRRRI